MPTETPKTKPKKVVVAPVVDAAYYEGVGRRREAVARVRTYFVKKGVATIGEIAHKAGAFIINGKSIEKIFNRKADQLLCQKPLTITDSVDRFVVSIHVSGGGTTGQIGAISHGLARALAMEPAGLDRPKLRTAGLLTRDARTRERRMVGTGGKSRRLKQSPKR